MQTLRGTDLKQGTSDRLWRSQGRTIGPMISPPPLGVEAAPLLSEGAPAVAENSSSLHVKNGKFCPAAQNFS